MGSSPVNTSRWGVRPEQLAISGGKIPEGWNALRGMIAREKFVGKVVQFEVETEGAGSIVVDGTLAQAQGIGAHVDLMWDARQTHIYAFAEDPEIGIFKAPRRTGAVAPGAVTASSMQGHAVLATAH